MIAMKKSMKSGTRGNTYGAHAAPRKTVGTRLAAGVFATALALAVTAAPAVDQQLPIPLEGGQAYAATYVTTSTKSASKASETYMTVSEGTYSLMCRYGSKMIDVPAASTGNNVAVKTWTSNNTPAQRFIVKRVSNGVYMIQVGCSGKYLADYSGTVVQQTKSNSNVQRWRFVKNGSYVML